MGDLFECRHCHLRFHNPLWTKELGSVCPICLRPRWKMTKGRSSPGVIVDEPAPRDVNGFTSDHAGHPLGSGMPTGSPLRTYVFRESTQTWRGESHLMAWERIMRADPCAYCGAPAGTVDHIEPKSKPPRGLGGRYSWLNIVGACSACNGSKAAQPLWLFLWHRAPTRKQRLAAEAAGRVVRDQPAKEDSHDGGRVHARRADDVPVREACGAGVRVEAGGVACRGGEDEPAGVGEVAA